MLVKGATDVWEGLTRPTSISSVIISSPSEQYSHHLADDIFKSIFMNEKFCISIQISLKFVPKRPVDNKSELDQVMAWGWTGVKPLPGPILTQFTEAYTRH